MNKYRVSETQTEIGNEGLIDLGGSPERFGYSWERFSDPSPEQELQFQRWTSLIPTDQWRDKLILDAGCGAGRNSYWAMKYGAAGGLAIDLDQRSINAARRSLADYPSLEVRIGSIYHLSEHDLFDIAFSIGVIHHLAEPETAIRKIAQAVKPGGIVLIWVYGYENNEWIVRIADPLRKALFSRLPLSFVYLISLLPTSLLWLILRLNIVHLEYFKLIRRFPFAHLRHIVFDQMIPRIAHYYRKDQAIALLQQANLTDIRVECVNDMSWAVSGRKPLHQQRTGPDHAQ